MPYKTSNAAKSRGITTDTTQSRLAGAAREHDDEGYGGTRYNISQSTRAYLQQPIQLLTDHDVIDDSVPAQHTSGSFSTIMMNTMSSNENSHNAGIKPSLSTRRRQLSVPKARLPGGPRPLDVQGNSRSVSGPMSRPFGSLRNPSASNPHSTYANDVSINDVSQYSFASIDPTHTVPQERKKPDDSLQLGGFAEPKFDFDAFHDNIVATSPRLDKFPVIGIPSQYGIPDMPEVPRIETRKFPSQPAIPIPTRKISGAGNLGRKGSSASTRSRLSVSKIEPMSQVSNTSTSILRGRRQTHFPPNAFNNVPTPPPAAKAPRKSLGPSTFVMPDSGAEVDDQRGASINGRTSSEESGKSGMSMRVQRGDEASRDLSKSPSTIRARTTYIPNRQSAKEYFPPSKTPEGARTVSMNVHTTPNRRSGTPGRTTTPGVTTRRQSVATGLGARTISPTDARRLKRISMVPPAPPLPATRISQAPPTPQPDLVSPTLVQPTTPGTGKRKNVTPSSSRTTPDPNRKSYSSGQSLSSNTTYNSTRNSDTLSARLAQQNVSTSRLSTPKPRTETDESPTTEEIPPVPAIPKSYESPASEIDQPFFSARSSSLQQIETPVSDNSIGIAAAEAFARLNIPDEFNDSFLFADQDYGLKARQKHKANDTDSSGRVPPLGLLPLTTPTAHRIMAFKDSAVARPGTPPEDHHKIKTPSTPMTASKATFFTKGDRGDLYGQNKVRSTTSHFAVRSNDMDLHDSLSQTLPPFTFEKDAGRRSVSPYLSTSAPKDSHEFPSYMRPNFTTELRRTATQARPNGPRAPSYSIPAKSNDVNPSPERSSDTSTTTSTSSIHMTLSKKKSDSRLLDNKTTSSGVSKHENMPPPKLPASATYTNLSSAKASSPPQKPSFFKSRRKTSASSGVLLGGSGLERQGSNDSARGQNTIGRPSLDSTNSIMSQSNKSASLLSVNSSAKPTPRTSPIAELDRDDLVAEDEMRKLASKRRDFESAARQLDALRARAKPADCISPDGALHTVNLNIFERGEIVDFPDIYFTGTKASKKIVGDLASTSTNFGYDDDRGDYNIVEGDHLAYRYEVVDILGKGSFGQVVRCVDHKTGILVAIKIIRNKKRFHQQALVEVDILQKLKEWDPHKQYNVVSFDQSFYFRGHLCISTDLLDMNLYEFIKAHDFRGFSLKLIRRFTKQTLQSLILLHGKKVIHCDLKPENILLAHPAHSEIKVIDFGSSCFENEKVYTYIQSRFYRSPEVILGMSYGMPIDMWSLGCILAELYTGYPIFPGENEQEQLACIMEIFGPPEKHLIEKSSRKKLFFDSMGKPRLTVSSKGRRRRPSSKDLRSVLKCDDDAFLDFITRCLRWDPTRRLNPHEATKHEFITGVKSTPISTRKHIANALSTPLKRGNSVANALSTRPLPQPPPSSLKPIVGVRQDSLGASPNKSGARRQSNANNTLQVTSQAKRASHAAMNTATHNSSSRFQAGRQNASSRSDLATAAAAASLVK